MTRQKFLKIFKKKKLVKPEGDVKSHFLKVSHQKYTFNSLPVIKLKCLLSQIKKFNFWSKLINHYLWVLKYSNLRLKNPRFFFISQLDFFRFKRVFFQSLDTAGHAELWEQKNTSSQLWRLGRLRFHKSRFTRHYLIIISNLIGLRKWRFLVLMNFFMNFDFKNGCKSEFKDYNEKACSWSRNRVSWKRGLFLCIISCLLGYLIGRFSIFIF